MNPRRVPHRWHVAACPRGFLVVVEPGGERLRQRWHWANPKDDRRRPLAGMWLCRSRPLIFTDYRKALRTAKRLNEAYRAGRDRMERYYQLRSKP